jgi:hypothetical protein
MEGLSGLVEVRKSGEYIIGLARATSDSISTPDYYTSYLDVLAKSVGFFL